MRSLLLALTAASLSCGGSRSPRPGPITPPAPTGEATAVTPTDAPTDTPADAPPAAPPRQLAAETAITSAWAATLTVPASWWIAETDTVITLQDPEREATVHLTAVDAPDRQAAIATAWARIQPDFALAVAQQVDLPGRDGWDALAQVVYVTPTAESRAVVAVARKKGATWHIAIIDGSLAALDRRGAQINAVILDLKVPGLDEESWAGKTPSLDAAHLARFDALAEELRAVAGVPGVAIAVVHGGKIVLESGHGVRALGGKAKVTPSTAFLIGSTTKSLTTLLMARLIDQGKFTWDTPVVDVLPGFALADAELSKKLLVKHTVCACTGMPRQDLEFLFEYAGWDPERRVAGMATMRPTTGFGETFQYSNVMVAVGGWIAAHASAPKAKLGPAYDQAMQRWVFGPLGMKSTTFDFRKARRGDHAESHGQGLSLDYRAIPTDYEQAVMAVRPAGGAWSTARDMARFMMLELAHGKTPDGKQLVSAANLERRREPQVKIDAHESYGLGLFVSDEHGVKLLHHGGNMLGFTSDLFLLPDHDVGVVVLTNAGAANAYRNAVRRAFLEVVFDGKAEARDHLAQSVARAEQLLADERALVTEADPAWIGPLLGAYDNPALGHLEVRAKPGGGYELDAGEWKSDLGKKTARDGTVELITTAPPYVGFELVPRTTGGATTLTLDAGQQVYVFSPAAR